MYDGGMGSLRLFPSGASGSSRFGRQVAQVEFKDKDGAIVSATLNVDEQGALFELDVWKTNFEPILEIPDLE